LRVLSKTPTSLAVTGDQVAALAMRTAVAAYAVLSFDVPRPRALLGEQHIHRIAATMRIAGARSFRISAAGRDSTVFQRLGAELASRTGLEHRPADGDVLVRIRPAWEVLVRLTPRPLSARAWRVRDVPGALNATIAAAMLRLAAPQAGERVLNLMCGSGTLLAECPRVALAVGLDNDPRALDAARANAEAPLVLGDVRRVPFQRGFDVVVADLPYGERSGSHRDNDALYQAFLESAAQAVRPGARLVAITHDIRRFERALASADGWRVERQIRVFQKGYKPAIWVMTR